MGVYKIGELFMGMSVYLVEKTITALIYCSKIKIQRITKRCRMVNAFENGLKLKGGING